MPDQPRNRKIIVLTLAIVIVSVILGGMSLSKSYTTGDVVQNTDKLEQQNAALNGQVVRLTEEIKASSARSECRNRLNNESIGNFQVDIRDLLLAGFAKDTAREAVILMRLARRPNPNDTIKKFCPPPLTAPSKTIPSEDTR